MTPRDCFGIIVRAVGLIVLLFGIYELLTSVYILLTPNRQHTAMSSVYSVYGAIFVALGLYFLRGAPGLMHFCYPNQPRTERSKEDAPHTQAGEGAQ